MTVDDYRFMAHALRLAERGLYTTDPNPRVGCVLVRESRVVGEGWHERAGEPHAEVMALRQAGARAAGSTAYVTLEPCSHHGKTPPCADALVEAGVARVVVAMQDPNPLVSGTGLARLDKAGIATDCGVLKAQAAALNPGFISRMTRGRPLVRCKLAMSLDGRTAMASGESQWITGPEARSDVHRLRARSSAVMTGIGTVLADDPSMTARPDDDVLAVPGAISGPLRVVLDSRLRIAPDSRLLSEPGPVWVVTAVPQSSVQGRMRRDGVEVHSLPGEDGRVDLAATLALLAEREINEVLLECGPGLAGAMLDAGLIDELVVYMAPRIMGDRARGLFTVPGLEHMDQNIMLDIVDIRSVGCDWRLVARPRVPE